MKKIIITIVSVLSVFIVYAQEGIDSVLAEIERNNTTLKAYRIHTDAERMGNKTGLLPDNPEVEFSYLQGSPSELGNRTDFAVTQSFDFPTAYVYKSQLAEMKNQQLDLEYTQQRFDVLLNAKLLCSELTFLNALYIEFKNRLDNDRAIAKIYKQKLEAGDATILDYNKAKLNVLNTEKKLEQIVIEREATQTRLAMLNAGVDINFTDSIFNTNKIEADFESWYSQAASKNPMLLWLQQEIAVSEKAKQLQVAQNLPKITAGYMSENLADEQFQGVSLGVSIPLWGNKNTVKYAKLRTEATSSMEADAKVQFYFDMKILHSKVISLQNSITDYEKRIAEDNMLELLKMAMQKGEMTLSEYYFESMLLYDSKEELLRMEKELNATLAKLNRYNL